MVCRVCYTIFIFALNHHCFQNTCLYNRSPNKLLNFLGRSALLGLSCVMALDNLKVRRFVFCMIPVRMEFEKVSIIDAHWIFIIIRPFSKKERKLLLIAFSYFDITISLKFPPGNCPVCLYRDIRIICNVKIIVIISNTNDKIKCIVKTTHFNFS